MISKLRTKSAKGLTYTSTNNYPTRLWFRTSAGLFRDIQRIAVARDLSISELCRCIIREYINERKATKRTENVAEAREGQH